MPKSVRAFHDAVDAQVKENAEAISKIGEGISKIGEGISKIRESVKQLQMAIKDYIKEFYYG
jgi:methyl-accepting chemotaxis protein